MTEGRCEKPGLDVLQTTKVGEETSTHADGTHKARTMIAAATVEVR